MRNKNDPSSLNEWTALQDHYDSLSALTLKDLFEADPKRFDHYHVHLDDGVLFDYSKNHVNRETIAMFIDLAKAQDLEGKREALFSGGHINTSEGRAAHHTALRESPPHVPYVRETLEQMKTLSESLRADQNITDILCLGIGGSFSGPYLVCDALKNLAHGPNIHFLPNIDGGELETMLCGLNPDKTAIFIASKTFTTMETIENAQRVKAWGDLSHFYAATENKQLAQDFGIPPAHILPLKDWIGGRYSVWSAIGLPIAVSCGFDVFQEFLSGASIIDRHFYETPFNQNIPFLMAAVGVFYRNFGNIPHHAVLPYGDAFRNLPTYLQQLDMESNGKASAVQTGPVVFGGIGTNVQHSFLQHLHQGTVITPVDFIMVARCAHNHPAHHQKLVANALAQAQALMQGQENHDEPYRHFEGNRPSSIFIFDELSPKTLGMLMALYEHKIFVQGVLWGINSFDQWGVELGKTLSKNIIDSFESGETPKNADSSTQSLIHYIQSKNG